MSQGSGTPVMFEPLSAAQQAYIRQVVAELARGNHLAASEMEEFCAQVDRALERNDAELLRAYDGRSTWETYVRTVIMRLFVGFRAELWGAWQPSGAARRMGPAAMLLEELVARDRLPLDDAIEVMRRTHRVDLSRRRLVQMATELGLVTDAVAAVEASAAVYADDAEDVRLRQALQDAMALVSQEDRLLLTLRFRDRQPLTRMAKLLRQDARPLQRRIDQVLDVLRTALATQGLAPRSLEALLERSAEAAPPPQRWWSFVLPRSSGRK